MSKPRVNMHTPLHAFTRRSRYQYAAAGLLVILTSLTVWLLLRMQQLPDHVWLPDSPVSGNDTLFRPVQTETVTTKYGRAIRYTTTVVRPDGRTSAKPMTTIYAFRTSQLLQPDFCPNIDNIKTQLPSNCNKLGEYAGSPVYAIHRNLPSGATEYYANLQGVFVYIRTGGDGGQNLDYIKTFKLVSLARADRLIAANKQRVNKIIAQQKAQQAATDQHAAAAYRRLDFAPLLPGRLPAGWELAKTEGPSIEIDGPDADHPKLLNALYADKNNKKQFIRWHVGKLSDFKLGAEGCGPSPGYSMEYLACSKIAGTDYYEATLYDNLNDFVRYLYRPVGASLLVTSTVVYAEDNQRPARPAALLEAQDALTANAKIVPLDSLTDSRFHKIYY